MKKIIHLFWIGLFLCCCTQSALAQLLPFNPTKTTVLSGSFSDPSIWSPSGVPGPNDSVLITTSHDVTQVSNASVKSIAIEPGATLNSSSFSLQIGEQDFSSIYRNQGIHNATGGKIICSPIGVTEFQADGVTNCDIEVVSKGPQFTFSSTLTINGNIFHTANTNFGLNNTLFIEVTNGSHININGNLTTSPLYTIGIDIFASASLTINGSVYLYGASETGTGSTITNRGNLSISGDLHIGENFGFLLNDTNANLTIGGDFLGEGSTSFFFQEVNATASFGGSVFPLSNDGVFLVSGTSALSGQSVEPNTIIYNGSVDQVLKAPSDGIDIGGTFLANTYSNLIINNSNSKSLPNNLTINGDLTISGAAQLDVTADNFAIDLKGNWLNSSTNPIAFNKRLGDVTFSGTTPQTITATASSGETFYNAIINNPSGVSLVNSDMSVSNVLSLTSGIVATGSNKLIVSNPASNGLVIFNQNSFINGNLRRFVEPNNEVYAFPIGNGMSSANFQRADLINNNLAGVNYLDAHVSNIVESNNNIDANIITSQGNYPISDVHNAAIWSLVPDAQPVSGTFATKLYLQNLTGLTDNLFFIVKRPSTSSNYADWNTFSSNTTVPIDNNPGRTIASGFALKSGFTSFSDFAIATATEAPTNFTVTASAAANGSISPDGVTTVSSGANQSYTITPSACYEVTDVLVDGISQGVITTYTFNNITANHTITATFAANGTTTYYADNDGDGFGNAQSSQESCTGQPVGFVTNSNDCNDELATVNSNASEVLGNGIDDNCDGSIDEVTPLSSLIASSCGVTLTNLSNTLFAYPLSNFIGQVGQPQGYRFRVTNGQTVRFIDMPTNSFTLTSLVGGAAYATTYTVEVSVKTQGYYRAYGPACTVTTPAVPNSTSISNPSCGSTLSSITTTIFCTPVASASGYRFRVRNGATLVGTYDSAVNRFSLTNLGISNIAFGTTYTVDVLLAFGGNFRPDSEYGDACSITTPATPGTSRVIQPTCGSSISNLWTTIFAQQVIGAQGYKFVVTNGAQTREFNTPNARFSLQNLAGGAAANTVYTIRVDVLYASSYVQGSVLCTITTTPGATRQTASALDIYEVKAYPNPYADTFKLDVNTSSEDQVGVRVYDMLGREVEARQSSVSDITNVEIGSQYPSGVYNIIVTQGDNVKTLRVIKR